MSHNYLILRDRNLFSPLQPPVSIYGVAILSFDTKESGE